MGEVGQVAQDCLVSIFLPAPAVCIPVRMGLSTTALSSIITLTLNPGNP